MSFQYSKAGVDIAKGNRFVETIRGELEKTRRPEVLGPVGGFAALFELKKYRNPVLVSSTDGVGTKLMLANQLRCWSGLGQDLVAMCVNDIACYGAEPLFFLDYLASSKLDEKILHEIVSGIATACQTVGAALVGGETAEMPGLYPSGEFDIAGFTVGVVEKEEILDGRNICQGDVAIGVASSGFHSNGFSLVRKILADRKVAPMPELLTPTRLYSPLVLRLKKEVPLKGVAHITGGGLIENPPRVLPKSLKYRWDWGSWEIPELMMQFKKWGKLSDDEFFTVFNGGIGLVLTVAQQEADKTLRLLKSWAEKSWIIGHVA